MASLENSFNKLYINGTKPESIQSKWPKIAQSDYFKNVSPDSILFNAFFYVEDSGDYLFLTVKAQDHPNVDGACFDIDKQTSTKGLPYYGADDQVLIGSYMRQKFYAITKTANGPALWVFVRHCYPGQPVGECPIGPEGNARRICKKGNSQIFVTENDQEPCDKVDWPILNGFITKDKFYLFGKAYVIIFPEAVLSQECCLTKFITDRYREIDLRSR